MSHIVLLDFLFLIFTFYSFKNATSRCLFVGFLFFSFLFFTVFLGIEVLNHHPSVIY